MLEYISKDGQTLWAFIQAISSIAAAFGTICAVKIALKPIREKAELGKALFLDALQIDIQRDGVMTITNVFDEPILLKKISQRLIMGSELNTPTNASVGEIYDFLNDPDLNSLGQESEDTMEKRLVPKIPFMYAHSYTHLPKGMEDEAVWVVYTRLDYESTNGDKNNIILKYRFSKTLEPRYRWVEL